MTGLVHNLSALKSTHSLTWIDLEHDLLPVELEDSVCVDGAGFVGVFVGGVAALEDVVGADVDHAAAVRILGTFFFKFLQKLVTVIISA